MNRFDRLLRSALIGTCLCLLTSVTWAESAFDVTHRYTAQRKPRVTVLEFEDTNAMAEQAGYGSSVEAMLVTFLKRKSQFVIVERQKLGTVLEEWQRNQVGLTNLESDDPGARELLERIDAIVLGNVTLLPDTSEAESRQGEEDQHPPSEKAQIVRGQRIEIDAKLLSRADGRIIAAAQRHGPVQCLRSIVERLGIALEQEFLRPYYGKLRFKLSEPENVRVFLTPILLDSALDEEKPPVEQSVTVKINDKRDIVEPWSTDPSTYTIENILSGLYSLRLERPGYEGLEAEDVDWQARNRFGQIKIFDRNTNRPLDQLPEEFSRFVVRVDAQNSELLDGDELGFHFRKKGGSIAPRIKRQYLDEDYIRSPNMRVTLSGNQRLELNRFERPEEFADDQICDMFDERRPNRADFGTTRVAKGELFDLQTFKGGYLYIEDYQGEPIAAGDYRMTIWEPNYQQEPVIVTVRDGDHNKSTSTPLVRRTGSMTIEITGLTPGRELLLSGAETGHEVRLPLEFEREKLQDDLPIDTYIATTNVPGLANWSKQVRVSASTQRSPIPASPVRIDQVAEETPASSRPPTTSTSVGLHAQLRVKTHFCIAGNLNNISNLPHPETDDLYIDHAVPGLLRALLGDPEKEEEKGGVWRSFAQAALNSLLPSPASHSEAASEARGEQPAAIGSTATGGQPEGSKPSSSSEAHITDVLFLESLRRLGPDHLRSLLGERLRDVDLLVLDEDDMDRLRSQPQTAAVVHRYIEAGGSLFAFVTDSGEYEDVVGAQLTVSSKKQKKSPKFELARKDHQK